ncbi:glycosyltransferase [Cellulosimicrobium arenosum]|uniref:Glycosyltransferase n=1 Tax=Cellulosimicrobium arenosum TaxID=2708133 RepID=A0A927G935_9MICO|nr:glycosyltransferase [Cellulosimicrobium arenosum]
MGTSSPPVSVVIAARDAAATLGEQLRAVCPQVVAVGGEVLVADNGSRDATRDVAEEAGRRWPGVRVVDASSGRGPGGARNIGVELAGASLVAFCDADDVVATGWLEAMLASERVGSLRAGRLDDSRFPGGQSWLQQADGLMHNPLMPGLWCAGAGNMAVGREAFLAIGGFCEELRAGEDVDLCWRAQLAGVEMHSVPDAVVYVRHRVTLRGIYRQMYGWGTGSAVLEERYAELRAAGLGAAPDQPSADGPPTQVGRRASVRRAARGSVRRTARLATAAGRADLASALGERRGRARGTFGAEVPRLSLDDVERARRRVGALGEAGGHGDRAT